MINLTSGFIYFPVCEIISKLVLNRNSGLSSTLALDVENKHNLMKGKPYL